MNKTTLIIIGLLCAVISAAGLFMPINSSMSKKSSTLAAIANIEIALDFYEAANGIFPTTEQGLKALIEKPTIPPTPKNWKQYFPGKKIIDPWNNPYQYRCPSQHNRPYFDIWSFGRDGKDGTEDDITSWSPTPEIYNIAPIKEISDYIGVIIIGVTLIILSLLLVFLIRRSSKKPPLTPS